MSIISHRASSSPVVSRSIAATISMPVLLLFDLDAVSAFVFFSSIVPILSIAVRIFPFFLSVTACIFTVTGIIYPVQLPNNVSLMRNNEKNAKKIDTAGRSG